MKTIQIEYGPQTVALEVPQSCDERGMKAARTLANPAAAIRESLENPVESLPLREIVRSKLQVNSCARAVIVVSDNTRPVPYRGPRGLLVPLLTTLRQAGMEDDQIVILIGNGSHRAMGEAEIEAMLGLREAGFAVQVVNHRYDDESNLVEVGRTRRGSMVKINRLYIEADLKIVTGLVETHFMAGASGGRKSICPAVAGQETLRVFHGPDILESPLAADLVLDGNPCHEEALQAARLAGCDFAVNVTLDSGKRLTGVFSGELESAHRRAVEKLREYVVVEIERRYDLVIVPAGFVGVNHYQAAKAATAAARAVRPGGIILLVARHTDPDPIGSAEYKKTLRLLAEQGPERFLQTLKSPGWTFLHDQWETQMWGKILSVIGAPENLLYCALEISREAWAGLPGKPGLDFLSEAELGPGRTARELMQEMAARALRHGLEKLRAGGTAEPALLFLRDGPYGVPELPALR